MNARARKYRLCSKQSKASYDMAVAVARHYGVGCYHDGSSIWLVHTEARVARAARKSIKELRASARKTATSHSMFSGLCQGIAAHYHKTTMGGLSPHVLAYLNRRQQRVTSTRAGTYDPVDFCAGLQASQKLI